MVISTISLAKEGKTIIDKCVLPSRFSSICFVETAKRSMQINNAGGSSNISEALSMQYMHWRRGASGFVPEKEAKYFIDYKMVDYLMVIKGEMIGVSVTRAVSYPFEIEFSLERARLLVNKKLYGLVVARECICEEHCFVKCILHVWCMTIGAARNVETAFNELVAVDMAPGGPMSYEDVSLVCTICTDRYIYTNYGTT